MTRELLGSIGPLLVLLVTTGCGRFEALQNSKRTSTGPGSAPFSVGITGSSDSVADAVLKGSLEPTFHWVAISGASQYKVTVFEADGVTVRCPEVTTSLLSHEFATCSLPDKGSYKFSLAPSVGGSWQDPLEQVSFTVDGLNLSPRQQELLSGESLQCSSENGTAPFTFGDAGTGFMNPSTGLLSIPLTAAPATLSLTIEDAVASTNSTTVKVRSFSDVSGFPYFAPQQGDDTYPESFFQMSDGTLLASLWTDPLPWMGHSTTYRSTDEGVTWALTDNTIGDYAGGFYSYGFVQTGNGTLINCGTGWDEDYNSFSQLRRSTDGGLTWSATTTYDPSGCYGITINPSTKTMVTVQEDLNGDYHLHRSTDQGQTWSLVASLPSQGQSHKLLTSPSGEFYVFGDSGLHKSTDDGLNWTSISSLPASYYLKDLVFLPNGTLVAAGSRWLTAGGWSSSRWSLVRSTDSGVTWTETDLIAGASPTYGGSANQIMRTPDGTILAFGGIKELGGSSSSTLIRKSTDDGATWSDAFRLTSSAYRSEVGAALQLSGGRILMATQGKPNAFPDGSAATHFSQSTDNGTTWNQISEVYFMHVYEVYPSDFAANESGRLVSAGETYDNRLQNSTAYLRTSLDGGQTWQTGLDIYDADLQSKGESVAIDSAGKFFVAIKQWDSGNTLAGKILIKTSTNGLVWSDFNTWTIPAGGAASVDQIKALPDGSLMMSGTLLNTGTSQDDAFFRKISSAGVETALVLLPPSPGADSPHLKDIALDPDGTTLWGAGSEEQSGGDTLWIVRKSMDGGATWTISHSYQPTTGAKNAKAVRIAFDSSGVIYVAGSSSDFEVEIHKSTDKGMTWTTALAASTGVSSSTFTDFAIDSQDRLLVSTEVTPDYRSTIGGSIWLVKAGALTEVDQFSRPNFYEAELLSLRRCGTSVCAAGVANSSLAEGRRLIVRKLSN